MMMMMMVMSKDEHSLFMIRQVPRLTSSHRKWVGEPVYPEGVFNLDLSNLHSRLGNLGLHHQCIDTIKTI